jgi:H+/Cl- antiporter ClcA
MLIAGAVGLVLGYVALLLVNAGIRLIWEDVPAGRETTPAWYVVAVLLMAAVLVYVVRRFVGDTGHSPINGIAVSPLTPRDYVGAILAILASLWGGVVLGPEVALVATGSMVGTVTAKAMRHTDAATQTKVVGVGALGAILALFVGPILSGSFELGSTPTSVELAQLAWAVPIAVIASVAVTLSRLVAALLARAADPGPNLVILVGAALVVAASALLLQLWTGESVMLVVTSGEEMITDLPTITTVSTAVAILVLKSIAYAVSLGAGYRGGPFFPAMFVGAAAGLLVALLIPAGPSVPAALVVGVIAAVVATAPMKWPLAIALGAIIGLLMGTWTLVPAAVVGAVVARAIPRWGDRVVVPAPAGRVDGDQSSQTARPLGDPPQ